MKIGTKLRMLVDNPDSAQFKEGDIVVVIGFIGRNSMEAQIEDSEEAWFLNRLMEGKQWEVVREQK